MVPQEKFRPYTTLLELMPPMSKDKAVWKKSMEEAQRYLMGRNVEEVPPDTIPFIVVLDHYISRFEKAKAMLADHKFVPIYRGGPTVPDILDFEILAPESPSNEGGERNEAKSG